MKFALAILFLAAVAAPPATAFATVDDGVLASIAAGEPTTVILHFNNGKPTSRILDEYHEIHRPTERAVLPDILPELLMENANRSQALVLQTIKDWTTTNGLLNLFEPLQIWMLNQLVVPNVTADLLNVLKLNPTISRIEENKEHQLIDPFEMSQLNNATPLVEAVTTANQWHIDQTGAPEALWARGCTGQRRTIGVIDTGVRLTHTCIKDNFRKDNGWYDAVGVLLGLFPRQTPSDDNGHGTHVTCTACGRNGLGVAPDSQWIACKALNRQGSGSAASIRACCQFMLCPTDPNGKNKDCKARPDFINNSYGGSEDTFLDDILSLWRAAGIIPVCANGNAGSPSACGTVGTPAHSVHCIGVGATTRANTMATFSSRGPTKNGTMKPYVCAPGQEILSASHQSDTGVVVFSGTSMSTPVVVGFLAAFSSCLEKAGQPSMTYDQAKEYLKLSMRVQGDTQTCGGIPGTTIPNNVQGWGVINATELIKGINVRLPEPGVVPAPISEEPETPAPPTFSVPRIPLWDSLVQIFQNSLNMLFGNRE